MNSIYVLGTDTSTGSTLFASALTRALVNRGLQVGVFKPVETGCSLRPSTDGSSIPFGGSDLSLDEESIAALSRLSELAGPPPATHSAQVPREHLEPEDARMLISACARDLDLDLVNPYRFAPDLEPAVVGQLTSTTLDLDHLKQCFRSLSGMSEVVIVDGCFGLMTPFGADTVQRDLIAALRLPVVLVAPSMVGTIGRCLMNVELLGCGDIPLAGVVLNRSSRGQVQPEETANPVNIEAHSDAVVRGVLPHFDKEQLSDLDYLAQRLEVHVDLNALLSFE